MKEEVQTVGDKFRTIGAPDIRHKCLFGIIEKNYDDFFKELFPEFWGLGLSFKDRELYMDTMDKLGYKYSMSMDISGMDLNHNKLLKSLWFKLSDDICEALSRSNYPFKIDNLRKLLTKKYTLAAYCCFKNNELDERTAYINSENRPKSLLGFKEKVKNQNTVCLLRMRDKMFSGQGYTSVLNTSILSFIFAFLKDQYTIQYRGLIAGDDIVLFFKDLKSMYTLFKLVPKYFIFKNQPKLKNHGVGLVLKFLKIGLLEDCRACSTMTYRCPQCGIKICRQLERILDNFYYSHKMLQLPEELRYTFFQMVCYGETQWSNNLQLYDKYINHFAENIDKNKVEQLVQLFNTKAGKKGKMEAKYLELNSLLNKLLGTNENTSFDREHYVDYFILGHKDGHLAKTLTNKRCCSEALNSKLQVTISRLTQPNELMYDMDDRYKVTDDSHLNWDPTAELPKIFLAMENEFKNKLFCCGYSTSKIGGETKVGLLSKGRFDNIYWSKTDTEVFKVTPLSRQAILERLRRNHGMFSFGLSKGIDSLAEDALDQTRFTRLIMFFTNAEVRGLYPLTDLEVLQVYFNGAYHSSDMDSFWLKNFPKDCKYSYHGFFNFNTELDPWYDRKEVKQGRPAYELLLQFKGFIRRFLHNALNQADSPLADLPNCTWGIFSGPPGSLFGDESESGVYNPNSISYCFDCFDSYVDTQHRKMKVALTDEMHQRMLRLLPSLKSEAVLKVHKFLHMTDRDKQEADIDSLNYK